MHRVIVIGAKGRMGSAVVSAIAAEQDLCVAAEVDRSLMVDTATEFSSLDVALRTVEADVVVDFTRPDSVFTNVSQALDAGLDCVVGTTGLTAEQLAELQTHIQPGSCLFVAPNFAIGAVLMMQAAQRAARYLDHVEIIELHHDNKLDAPSGTALRTAELIDAARRDRPAKPGAETERPTCAGARGADYHGISIHSVRLPGFVAHQEVIFGGEGQTLTIRHDSTDRTSFMPGVMLACHKVGEHEGLVVGLENLLED